MLPQFFGNMHGFAENLNCARIHDLPGILFAFLDIVVHVGIDEHHDDIRLFGIVLFQDTL